MRAAALLLVAAALAACSSAPKSVAFQGTSLKKAAQDKLAGTDLHHVVYTPDGEDTVHDSKQVLTVVWSEDLPPEKVLQSWTDVWGTSMSIEKWLVTAPTSTSACKVSRFLQNGRFSVAVTSCAQLKGKAGCAEWDEVVPLPCSVNDQDCRVPASQKLCAARVEKLGSDLDDVLRRVAR